MCGKSGLGSFIATVALVFAIIAPQSIAANMVPSTGTDWYNQTWSDPVQPYADIRKQLEAGAVNKEAALNEVTAAEAAYSSSSNPTALDVYRFGYAAWLYQGICGSFYIGNVNRHAVVALMSSHFFNSYDLVRLMYLFGAWVIPQEGEIQAAHLLLVRDPDDYDVIAAEIHIWPIQPKRGDNAYVFSLCKRLLALRPKDPNTYESVGTLYYVAFSWDKDDSDRAYSIKMLRKFQSMSSPNDRFNVIARNWIKDMKTM